MRLPADVLHRLRTDRRFYAEECLYVIDEDGQSVRLKYRPAQVKVAKAEAMQRAKGLPVRIIVLKSRKTGVSTEVQGWGVQDTTLNANGRALVVAQDSDTAGELWDIGYHMYVNLPVEYGDQVKPGLIQRSRGQKPFLHFGEPSQRARERGELGINSTMKIDTAATVSAGRGKTIRFLHLSEVAFWEEIIGQVSRSGVAASRGLKKALSVVNAVPDRPGTVIVWESTAQGHNMFKGRWDRAMRGLGGYAAVFIGWLEDENCWKAFPSPDEQERFVREDLHKGPYGVDEPYLEEKGASLEQLYWRRGAIIDKADGKLEYFKQEYPSNATEAFISSGKHVFSLLFIARAVDLATKTDPPDEIRVKPDERPGVLMVPPAEGVLVPGGMRLRKTTRETIEVPESSLWVPQLKTGFGVEHPFWRVWEHPVTAKDAMQSARDEGLRGESFDRAVRERTGQYIAVLDPARGESNAEGEADWSAITVWDHRTLRQVARYRSKIDLHLVAEELLLACLYYNRALAVPETTDGVGLAIAKDYLHRRFGYPRIYEARAEESPDEDSMEKLGFKMTMRTKPEIEAVFTEALRENVQGIRDRETALELNTYVHRDRKPNGADGSAHDDLIDTAMIFHYVARQVPFRIRVGSGVRTSKARSKVPS